MAIIVAQVESLFRKQNITIGDAVLNCLRNTTYYTHNFGEMLALLFRVALCCNGCLTPSWNRVWNRQWRLFQILDKARRMSRQILSYLFSYCVPGKCSNGAPGSGAHVLALTSGMETPDNTLTSISVIWTVSASSTTPLVVEEEKKKVWLSHAISQVHCWGIKHLRMCSYWTISGNVSVTL